MPTDRSPLTAEEIAAQQAAYPPWLKLTPKQREEDAALQVQLASAGPRAHLNREEVQLMRAAALQHHARAQLLSEHSSDDEVLQARATMAEGLALAGEFREAADIHPHEVHRNRFSAIADAIERDDDERCKCVPAEHKVDDKTVTVHNRNITETVMSKKHGKLMPLIKCQCGDENVRAPGEQTGKRQQAVKTAMREAHRR